MNAPKYVLTCNFAILRDNDEELVLHDVGPWDEYRTITNDIIAVVAHLAPELRGRRLLYYDSENDLTCVLVKDGKFAGFAHARNSDEDL